MKDFKKLIVWQKCLNNFVDIPLFTRHLPPEEKFELSSQIKRAAFSIPANIAEGSAKATNNHYKLFLENALGSSYEVETALIAIQRIYKQFQQQTEVLASMNIEVQKMLISLINKLI